MYTPSNYVTFGLKTYNQSVIDRNPVLPDA